MKKLILISVMVGLGLSAPAVWIGSLNTVDKTIDIMYNTDGEHVEGVQFTLTGVSGLKYISGIDDLIQQLPPTKTCDDLTDESCRCKENYWQVLTGKSHTVLVMNWWICPIKPQKGLLCRLQFTTAEELEVCLENVILSVNKKAVHIDGDCRLLTNDVTKPVPKLNGWGKVLKVIMPWR